MVCEGQLGGESAHAASSLSFLSVCLSISVSLSLNVPSAQLRSHYLLITLDTTATGSTITKRAERKSATFVLTLFVDFFFFPLGGGMLNVPLVIAVIQSNMVIAVLMAISALARRSFCLFMSCRQLNYIDGLIGNFRSRASQLMNDENHLLSLIITF